MSSMLNSSNLVFATVMVVSSTAVILAFLRQNKPDISPPPPQFSDGTTSRQPEVKILRPCLSSGTGGKKERKKKKVQFADNVNLNMNMNMKKKKETERIMNLMKKKTDNKSFKKTHCRNSGNQIPQNRIALYNAILRDRSHRILFSY